MGKVWKTLALVAALSLALVACGSDQGDGVATLQGGDGASSSASASPSVDPEDALADFAQCMRDNGIEDFPDPTIDENGGITIGVGGGGDAGPPSEEDRQKIADAMDACQELLPRGDGPGQISPEDQAAFQDAMVEYAQCMRDHGIDIPDPDFSGGGGFIQQIGDGIDPEDPDFQAADEACRPILDDILPGGGQTAVSGDDGN
jgi:hypothetical protein